MTTAPVAPLMNKKLLVSDEAVGITVYVEEVVSNLVLGSLTGNHKDVDNCISVAFEMLVDCIILKVLNSS